jgi:hypothetical protein
MVAYPHVGQRSPAQFSRRCRPRWHGSNNDVRYLARGSVRQQYKQHDSWVPDLPVIHSSSYFLKQFLKRDSLVDLGSFAYSSTKPHDFKVDLGGLRGKGGEEGGECQFCLNTCPFPDFNRNTNHKFPGMDFEVGRSWCSTFCWPLLILIWEEVDLRKWIVCLKF